jgi:ribosome-binding ATPase YchF (GTP1/OBG family)
VHNELHAWTIQKGTTAPQAAGKIHTDFEHGFIRAEIIKFADLDRLGSETAIKDAGLLHIVGHDYIIEDGDVMFVRFNV